MAIEANDLPRHVRQVSKGISPRADRLRETFYADCSDADFERARSLLVPSTAVRPWITPLRTTETNFGRVPRVYIECLQDHAISIDKQRTWYAALPVERVITMDTSHSPFLSAPDALAAYLMDLQRE